MNVLDRIADETLTDRHAALSVLKNYQGLQDAGQPRNIGYERYLKLALIEGTITREDMNNDDLQYMHDTGR